MKNVKLHARLVATAGLRGNHLTVSEARSILSDAYRTESDPLDILFSQGGETLVRFFQFLADALGVPFVDVDEAAQSMRLFTEVDTDELELMKKTLFVIFIPGDGLDPLAVCADPTSHPTRTAVQRVWGDREGRPRLALGYAPLITRELTNLSSEALSRSYTEVAATTTEVPTEIAIDDSSPVARYFANLLEQAVARRASDIHINWDGPRLVAKLRIDGLLQEAEAPPRGSEDELIAHIMYRSNMDQSNKRFPQDGRLSFNFQGRVIDGRVNSLPTIGDRAGSYRVKLSIRILDKQSLQISLAGMGLSSRALDILRRNSRKRQGAIIVSGPTGSGKTTTLYSLLKEVSTPDKHVMTIEDPVEFQLPGLVQVQVARDEEQGVGFNQGLRAMMRSDPDIIMVGEIRDVETAKTAADASITGHLVLSTIHAPSAIEVFTRLVEMGVAAYAAAEAITVTTAQRLLRKVCDRCKVMRPPTDDEKAVLARMGVDVAEVADGPGCPACGGTGYKGRTAIAEVLEVTPEIAHLVATRAPAAELRKVAKEQGFETLAEDALRHVLSGTTSVAEYVRAVDLSLPTGEEDD